MRQKKSAESGFTLIETTIAVVILVIVLVGVASVFLYSTTYNSGATDRAMALVVAQRQMEELRNVPFNSPELYATSGTTTVVVNAGHEHNVVLKITDTSPTRKTISVEVIPSNPTSQWYNAPVILITQRSALPIGQYIG